MSRSCSSTLFVGVRLTEVYTEKKVTTTVTKYDSDTGKPVQRNVEVLQRTFFGKPLPDLQKKARDPYSSHSDGFDRDFEELSPPAGLELEPADDDLKNGLIGIEVGKGTDHYERLVDEVTLADLIAAVERVSGILTAAGCTADTKIFNVLSCG